MNKEDRKVQDLKYGNKKIYLQVVDDSKYFIIPVVSFALLILALNRFYGMFYSSINFDFRYLAAIAAFLGLIANFVRDGYGLLFRKFIYIPVLFLIIEVTLERIFLPYGT